MRIRFLTLEDILAAGLPLDSPPNHSKTNRLTRSAGLEDMIYSDLYQQDDRMRLAESKLNLSTAEELARDVVRTGISGFTKDKRQREIAALSLHMG